MDFSLVYLVRRFAYRFVDFFHHWYVDGSRAIADRFMGTIESIDRSLALKITLKHFFEPLYKDYSIIGRILGIVFRTGRVIIGFAAYFFVAIAYAILYVVWVAIPASIIFYAILRAV